jgi:hypothetical protein
VLIPLARTAPLEVQVRARAFNFPGARPQRLTMRIGGRLFGPFTIGPEWQVVTFQTPQEVWRAGLNRARVEFTEATTPVSVGLSGDTRALAAAVDVIRVTIR